MSARALTLVLGERTYELRLSGPGPAGEITLTGRRRGPDGDEVELGEFHGRASVRDGAIEVLGDEGRLRVVVARDAGGVWVSWRGRTAFLRAGAGARSRPPTAASGDEIRAPMTGVLVEVRVAAGDRVAEGATVAVLEAMKMEYRLATPRDGVVREARRRAGERVEMGDLVVALEAGSAGPADGAEGEQRAVRGSAP
jgi:biotin carboxyl carrier protein